MMSSSDRLVTTGFINSAAFPALEPQERDDERQPEDRGVREDRQEGDETERNAPIQAAIPARIRH